MPEATAAAPAPPDVIPDGPPEAVALTLLASVDPKLVQVTRARIDQALGETAALVEQARLSATQNVGSRGPDPMELGDFIRRAAQLTRLRRTLERRLALLSGATPAAVPASDEVADLVLSVRRWRPGAQLRDARARMLAGLNAELAEVGGNVQSALHTIRSGSPMVVSQPPPLPNGWPDPTDPHRTGLMHQHDEGIRRLTTLLERRRALAVRLAGLDKDGDSGRAASVREAIAEAGGLDDLVEVLTPMQSSPSASEVDRLKRAIAGIEATIAGIDMETVAASRQTAQRHELAARIPDLEARVIEERGQSARSLIAEALGGSLAGIAKLEAAALSARPELAEALGRARGGRDDLAAVIAEMMA